MQRALASLKKQKDKEFPTFQWNVGKRPNNKLDLARQKNGMAKFSLAGALCGAANSERQQPSSSSSWTPSPNMVEFVILGPKLAKSCTHVGGKTKSGQTEGRTDKVRFTLQAALWQHSA